MKYTAIKRSLIAALLSVALAGAVRAAAQTGSGPHPGFGGPRMFDALQLSDTQKTSIQNLFAANRETVRPLHQQLQEQRQLLKEATAKQPFDEAQVRFQAQELAKLQAELIVARASLMNQVSAILTPEQRTTLSTLREQRRQQFEERHPHPRGNPGSQQG